MKDKKPRKNAADQQKKAGITLDQFFQQKVSGIASGRIPNFEIAWHDVHPDLDPKRLRLRVLRLQRKARWDNRFDFAILVHTPEHFSEMHTKYAKSFLEGVYNICRQERGNQRGLGFEDAVRRKVLGPLSVCILAELRWVLLSLCSWNQIPWLRDPQVQRTVIGQCETLLRQSLETLDLDISLDEIGTNAVSCDPHKRPFTTANHCFRMKRKPNWGA